MRAADHIIDIGPGAGEHGGQVVAAGHAGRDRWPAPGLGHRRSSCAGAARDRRCPERRRTGNGKSIDHRGAREHNLKNIDVEHPARHVRRASPASPAPASPRWSTTSSTGAGAAASTAPREQPGAHDAIHGLEHIDKVIDIDQSPIGRTPRSNPATYTGAVRRHPRPVRPDAGGEGARLRAGPLLVQRQGRPLRGLPGRRHHQDRDALPARRLRAVRGVQRPPLQPRDAGGAVQGQVRSPTCST